MAEIDEPLRVVLLHGDRTLVVRRSTPADADALEALYGSLSLEDRHRRFFSGTGPPRSVVEGWASVAERGGCGLLAEVDGVLVAEAGYAQLPNGDGEFAITVAPGWRGWLGPFLFDVLVEEAAARGVANLEGDILLENAPMLSLVRSRGYATMAHTDFSEVRVVIGTRGRTPGWPARDERPRVLVEARGGRWAPERQAEAAGLHVVTCPGPAAHGASHCPVLDGRPCPLAEGADAIVHSLPAERPDGGDPVLDGLRRLHPDVPVLVERGPRRRGEAGRGDGLGAEEPEPEPDRAVTACGPAAELLATLRQLLESA